MSCPIKTKSLNRLKELGVISKTREILDFKRFNELNDKYTKRAIEKYDLPTNGKLLFDVVSNTVDLGKGNRIRPRNEKTIFRAEPNNKLFDLFNDIIVDYKNNYTIDKPQNNTIKDGVTSVFEENPELSNIGTQEEYSQYLDTIFPDSEVNDIVYRGDKSKTINGVTQFLNNKRFRGTQKEPLFLSSKKEVASNQRYYSDYSEFIYLKDDKGNLGDNFDPGSSIRRAVDYLYLKNNNNINKYGENIDEDSIDYRIAKNAYDKLSEKGKKIIKELDFSKEKSKNEFPYIIKTKKDLDKYEGVFKGQLEFGNKNFVAALVNVVSPKIFNANNKRYNEYEYGKHGEESLVTDVVKDNNVDSLIIENVEEEGGILSNTIAIKNPEQLHILGSKQDIEGFKNYKNNHILEYKNFDNKIYN